jgi:hypothetical protein
MAISLIALAPGMANFEEMTEVKDHRERPR